MRRREFIGLVGGVAAIWPFAARAQTERMRRAGVLLPSEQDDVAEQQRVAAFIQGLHQFGWSSRRAIHLD
jgi:putative tryptophan/tyrosine transport system substrate-binding protein